MNTTANRATIDRFYGAFTRRDGAAMGACYAADATFRDPVFELHGTRIGKMWEMLCSRGKDLRVDAHDIATEGDVGRAICDAHYTFSASGRAVHNVLHARFRFANAMIVEHVDAFDFWRWSRQALGSPGLLLGWTPMLRAKVRAQAAASLDRFVDGAA